MQRNWMLGLCGLAAGMACTMAVWGQHTPGNQPQSHVEASPLRAQAIARFRAENPDAGLYFGNDGRISRVYNHPFATGASPHEAGEQFLTHVGMWGIAPADLSPKASFEGGSHLQPVMYENGAYKFTGVYYTQQRDGIDVFQSQLILLARNVPGYPIVLASANLRDIGDFHVDAPALAAVNEARGVAAARNVHLDNQGTRMPRDSVFTPSRTMIFAGVEDQPFPATLAVVFEGEGGDFLRGDYQKRLFVANASTGQILHHETLVFDVNVTGNVSGMATEGFGADYCGNEVPTPLPYAQVQIQGGSSAFADVNGNFNIPNAGSTQVTVLSALVGQYFVVNNHSTSPGGPTNVESLAVTPPGPANLMHNSGNANEYDRAEVNTYIHANLIRDLVLANNPAYPTISGQTSFPINVNQNLNCNAFYNQTSINFYVAGGTCPNTGFSTVAHHEYGHHISRTGGNGTGGGAYGEGTGDCMGLLMSDNAWTGLGWNVNNGCSVGLRTADNTCLYQTTGCSSCGSESHACGRLISGCVWSLRNNLLASNPSDYRQILNNLVINAIVIHGSTGIAPDITIDYLTLDDDDGNLLNSTPHRPQISAAFAAHNMPAPPLPLAFTYPLGQPTLVSPGGGTVLRVVVGPGDFTPQPGATFHLDTGSGFNASPMTLVAPNTYEATFPAAPCGTTARYYVSAQTTTGSTATSPFGAPGVHNTAFSATTLGAVAFTDNFQTNLGWTVTNTATDGFWTRVTPNTVCIASPPADADGSGMCYVTDNGTTCSSSDVDAGSTTLTSPNMDATNGPILLSYWRWYFNNAGTSPHNDTFVVEISSNGGSTWQNLETVGPIIQADGGWFFRQFNLASIPGFALTNQFRVRFIASDAGTSSTIEAAVDGVKLQHVDCGLGIPGDITGDGEVNLDDLLVVIANWGPCPAPPTACPADVVVNGQVDVNDMLFVIANWG